MNTKRLAFLLVGALLTLTCSLFSLTTPTPTIVVPTGTTMPSMASTETPTVTPTVILSTPATPSAIAPQGVPIAHLSAGQQIKITYIHMLNGSTGWGVGGLNGASDHVLRTADGGQSWRDVTPPEPAPASGQKEATGFFLDASTAWVVYALDSNMPQEQAFVWFTHDGGATWQYSGLTEPDLYSERYTPGYFLFVDAQYGWLLVHVGAGMNHDYYVLLGTSDGGTTWHTLITPTGDTSGTQSCAKTGLVFINDQIGWMTIDCHGVAPIPYFFKTSDGGATWSKVELSAPAGTTDLFNQWYCGLSSSALFTGQAGDLILECRQSTDAQATIKSYLYETQDGGSTWNTYVYPGGNLQFVSTTTAFALARDIRRSVDAGHTWSFIKTVYWDGQFSFVDTSHVWAVARAEDQIALVVSTNGGQLWAEIHPTVAP